MRFELARTASIDSTKRSPWLPNTAHCRPSSPPSSRQGRRRGQITPTGNAHIRQVLVQAAHNARYRPNTTELRSRLEGLSPDLVQLAHIAQRRLHQRYWHLQRRIGAKTTIPTVARALPGFAWAVGQRMTTNA